MVEYPDGPRLLADIGGTYARFALESAPRRFERVQLLKCAEHADFQSAVGSYLAGLGEVQVQHAAVAIANPVDGDLVRMTNYPWQFSIEAVRAQLGFETLLVVNDFTALAMSLPHLAPEQLRQVGDGSARAHSVMGVLGAGTGLGVSAAIPAADGWVSLGTEGGHVAFTPQDERERHVLEYAARRFEHVSAERLLSGTGITLIHAALCDRDGVPAGEPGASDITRRALAGDDLRCVETLEVFCAALGTLASNIAVTFGAFGGIYIGGRIVPSLGRWFDHSGFRRRFEAKGRFSDYVRSIPTFVITADTATFAGTSAILDAELRRRPADRTIVERVRRARSALTQAERRVAELVLARPRTVLNDPIVEIARQAGVSQPTVIRFCRSLGCRGFPDFKLKLAAGLTGTIPVTHSLVTSADSPLELGAKVLSNSAAAVLNLRDQLDRDGIDRAIELLSGARCIQFVGIGNHAVVATDAQYKFLRFGVPTLACVEPRLQAFAAGSLGNQDVLVIVSSNGKAQPLLDLAAQAQAQGAAVIAITASQSPLARRAGLTIAVDHDEETPTQMSMVSRILHLLVIDILAVGVAMRRSGATLEGLEAPEEEGGASRGRKAPGGRQRRGLARITSHSG